MFKFKDIIIGVIISAFPPLLLMAFVNYYPSTEVLHSDGSVTVTAQWMSYTLTSFLFTVVFIFALYMIIRGIFKMLKKNNRR